MMKMRKSIYTLSRLLLVTLLVLSLGGCNIIAVIELHQDKTISSADGKWSLTVPGTWVDATDSNQDMQLEVACQNPEQYVGILAFGKANLVTICDDLEHFVELRMMDFENALANMQAGDFTQTQVAGCDGLSVEVTGYSSAYKYIYWLTYLETEDAFVEVQGYSLASNADDVRDTVRGVMETLKIQ